MNAETKKRYKDIDFPFTCPLSHREFNSSKGLSVYLTKGLKIDHSEYYDKYINHRDSSCFFCQNKGEFISASKGYRNLYEPSKKTHKSLACVMNLTKNILTLCKNILFNGVWICFSNRTNKITI
jgi:hypothetical protein